MNIKKVFILLFKTLALIYNFFQFVRGLSGGLDLSSGSTSSSSDQINKAQTYQNGVSGNKRH
jgi:preprotein translocase subunit SecF